MARPKGIGGTETFVLEQTRVARYLAFPGEFTVPDFSRGGDPDHEFQGFGFAGVVTSLPAVLFFRTKHSGSPTLSIDLNGDVMEYTFTEGDPPLRCWQQIIPGGVLKIAENDMIFGATGDGAVVVSDVVILYTSNELTVKIPIVISAEP